jgi:hypothetical protein
MVIILDNNDDVYYIIMRVLKMMTMIDNNPIVFCQCL